MNTSFLNAYEYFLNPFAIPVLVVSTLLLLIGIFVLTQNPKASSNLSFFVICVCSCIWLYGMSLVYCSRTEVLAHNWYQYFTFFGVTNIAPSIYFFSAAWSGTLRKKKKWVASGYLGALIFFLASALSPYGISGIREYFWGFYPVYGPIAASFVGLFIVYYVMALQAFLVGWRQEVRPQYRRQYSYITVAYVITFFGACDFIPKLAPISLYPFGYLTVLLWLSIVAYSIIRYKVMDIETVIHKTLMWAALSSLVFLPLGLTMFYFRDLLLYIHPVLSSIFGVCLFLLFMMYARTIQPWIDHIFQRRKHDLEAALIRFNDNLVYLKGLDDLAAYIVQTIRETLYVDKVQIFLKQGESTSLIQIDTEADADAEPSCNNAFIHWLEREDKLVLTDFVDLDPRFEGIKNEAKTFFDTLGVQVVIPLILNRELIGLINLGKKANLKSFRGAELAFLSELRRAATIALSNSLRLIEMHESLRKWNEELEEKVRQRTEELETAQKQLIQAEKLATIGTLAGGVAHEINNPLTAVLTNAQLLKMGKVSQEDIESIQLIEDGAKRCQLIIQKLMKYARKPAVENLTEEVDINAVIENMIGFLRFQFEQDNVQFVKKLNPVSKIRGVANELEQVFTNLALNAKDAVKSINKPGIIEIETCEKNGAVLAFVKDNGVGISQANLSKIFDPFFTTKDVGKGTGLGLAVSYGIVKKYNGNIDVASKLNEGTTFTVAFPKTVRQTTT